MHILNLSLASTALAQQQAFYTRLLERSPVIATDQQLSYQVGSTRLTFTHMPAPLPGIYHFAFNIPENQFDEARRWVVQYAPLLKESGGREIFYSENWKADILYFNDADGNILELIARHSLSNASNTAFSAHSLENVSEIGIASDDMPMLAAQLEADIGAKPYYWSGSDSFMPVGDEHGLFIIVRPGRIWFPDSGMPAWHMPLRVQVEDHGGTMSFEYP